MRKQTKAEPSSPEATQLHTLGGLALEGTSFRRPKPLLLLAYLALEGPQHRRHLAELFWPQAADHLKSLTVALTQLRQGAPNTIQADDKQIRALVATDVGLFLNELEQEDLEAALIHYRGPFLEGIYQDWGEELEEWVYGTRERLAGRARGALLRLAEAAAAQGDFSVATQRAEAAHLIKGAEPPDPYDLERLQRLLLAGQSPYAAVITEEAGSFGIEVTTSANEARVRLQRGVSQAGVQSLPRYSIPFVGRKQEIKELEHLLLDESTCRLVTLVGPGGMGKTRLAAEVALGVSKAFLQGVFFVPLVSATSASGAVSAVAEALGFSFYSNAPLEQQLLGYLRDKELLLLLDNVEQLVDIANFVADLLREASTVKLLVTSRESLHLQEEWVFPLDGLSFPQPEAESDSQDDATRLFELCARRAHVHFPLEAKRTLIVNLCALVDGTPLALELAASWLRVLPLESIVRELEGGSVLRTDILTARQRDVPDRHRSMRAVLFGSWKLLHDEERAALKRLSVFRGGFRREAAEVVAGASLSTLANLVEKSLLRVSEAGRYQLHELLRQFAAERLAEDKSDEAATHVRHRTYYLELLEAQEVGLKGKVQVEALEKISKDLDNIRIAWDCAVAHDDLRALGNVSDSIYCFYKLRSFFQEGYERFSQAATRWQFKVEDPDMATVVGRLMARQGVFSLFLGRYAEAKATLSASLKLVADHPDRVFALTMLGRIAHQQGERNTAEELYRDSIEISREAGDINGLVDALNGFAAMKSSFADFEGSKTLANECLNLCRQLGQPDLIAGALSTLAWPTNCFGGYEEAVGYWQESLALYQNIGDRHGVAIGLNFLGWSDWCIRGSRSEKALPYLERALAVYREVGHRTDIAMCLGDLALVENDRSNYLRAIEYGQEGLAVARAIGHFDLVPYSLFSLGEAAGGLGDLSTSRTYLFEAATLSVQRQVPDHATIALFFSAKLFVRESKIYETQNSLRLQKQAGAVALLTYVLAHPACWQVIKDRAERLLAELEAALPTEVVAEARAESLTFSPEMIITMLHKDSDTQSHL